MYDPSLGSTFDQNCGTFDTSGYQDKCGSQEFLCGDTSSDFAKCMIATDCKMYQDMQSSVIEKSATSREAPGCEPVRLLVFSLISFFKTCDPCCGGALNGWDELW